MAQLTRLLNDKRTLIVVGPGGVGKTTTSAALALHGARLGKKVLVLTVDPARRLANAMGLDALGHDEVRISPALFAEAGVKLGAGALYAMMLDTKTTFDRLIERHAPNEAVRERILSNRFYQQTSSVLAGSQEYMAMEKLHEIRTERDYDLVVLDTPPTAHALDFLTAPDRLEDFLDLGAMNVVLAGVRTAGRFGLGLLKFNAILLRVMNRFIGTEMFLGLIEFIESFQEMYGGFRERAKNVRETFRADDVSFAVVASPDQPTLDEGLFLHARLLEGGMPFGALVVNRVREPYLPQDALDGLADRLVAAAAEVPSLRLHQERTIRRVARRTADACERYAILATQDARRIAALREALGDDGQRVSTVPLFERDIHDLRGLAEFADVVFAQG